jgi:DNA-binding XRE family transcriptional regulator
MSIPRERNEGEKRTYLSKVRVEAGMTQQELADHLGIRRQTLSNWERGFSIPKNFQEISYKVAQLYHLAPGQRLMLFYKYNQI